MKAKVRVEKTGEKRGRPGQVSEKARGGGYGDARAAKPIARRKTEDKPSEKKRGGGYGDARSATKKRRGSGLESKSTENTRKPS
jgi:hypothetical protein